jgi:ribose transport system ATP-binding protein
LSTAYRLELSGVGKRFGSTTVLQDVSFHVEPGHILGLVGQNGAGKSTIVKILAGLYPDYLGAIRIDGVETRLANPRQARAAGIAVIYQEFSLVSEMTVAENLLLGREPGGKWGYSSRAVTRRAADVLKEVGIDIGVPLSTPVAGLSPAMKQRIEIAKALADNAKVLLMDEPTARLSNAETRWLFDTMRQLADRGVGVVFISHFLEEVLEITDWVTVLRNGRVVASVAATELDLNAMTKAMLGEELRSQELTLAGVAADGKRGELLLEATNVSAGERLKNIQLEVHAGEIVGVAGLVGSGRSRLCRVLAGADLPTAGEIRLRGKVVQLKNPHRALRSGITLIPEDRKNQALSLVSPIKDNIVLMALGKAKSGFVSVTSVKRLANKLVDELQVSPQDIDVPVGNLSGGNQQKVVVGKATATNPDVLIIDQPTAGVDVGTKAQLHRVLRELANSGAGLIVVSDDLDELFTLSDRLCVMRKGTIAWEGPASEMDRETLLKEISVTTSTAA